MALILSGDTGPSFVQSAAQPTGSALQVVNGTLAAATTLTNTTWASVNLSASITPKFSTSKILVFGQIFIQLSSATQPEITLYRNGSNLLSAYSDGFCSLYNQSGGYTELLVPFSYYDSPASTSALTYTLYGRQVNGSSAAYFGSTTRLSVITAMEIAA
jgi:hypothetical protein